MERKRKILAEFAGTATLLVAVVGSGIMGESLAQGNIAVALLANSIATGAILYVLINSLGPISGAHFNPAVTLHALLTGEMIGSEAFKMILAQVLGALAGVMTSHLIFGLDAIQISSHDRSAPNLLISEIVATLGLLFTIKGFLAHAKGSIATGVALYIVGAYWFTSSTSFANPAVTLARSITDTFAGIAPTSVPGFIGAQLVAVVLFRRLEIFWKRA